MYNCIISILQFGVVWLYHVVYYLFLEWSTLGFSTYICLVLSWQMSTILSFHTGYDEGTNRSSRNIASTAGVIFSPTNEFVYSGGIFLGHATNNIAKYEAVIALMTRESTLGIRSLVVCLDSELIISQLTSHYSVCNLVLYHKYLRARLLEWSFDSISYEHVPREFNTLAHSLANEVLDWHFSH